MIKTGRTIALGALLLAAACAPKAEAPAPRPAPAQPRPLPPQPAPPAAVPNWSDIPLTAGSWSYSDEDDGSRAIFGVANNASFTVRCDRRQRRIMLSRQGPATGGQMTIRTSFGARNLPIAGGSAHSDATVAASDPFLDSMVFSRGRFTVEAPGLAMLVVPTWPEPARVIEDCRS